MDAENGKYRKIADDPPEFMWIDVDKIHVDASYQRDASNHRLSHIASRWSWLACGAISVAKRKRGEFFAFEGQHRVLVALRRGDIPQLPCLVYKPQAIEEEARGFVNINTVRGPLRATSKFKANLVAKDADSIGLSELLGEHGYSVSDSKGAYKLRCVGALLQQFRQDADLFREMMLLYMELWPLGESFHVLIIRGLFTAERFLRTCKPPHSLLKKANRDAIVRTGPARLVSNIAEATAYHDRSSQKVWAQAMLKAVNRGRSTRKLPELF